MYLFEAAVHYLKLLPAKLGVSAQYIDAFWFVPHNLHLKIVNVMIWNHKHNMKCTSMSWSEITNTTRNVHQCHDLKSQTQHEMYVNHVLNRSTVVFSLTRSSMSWSEITNTTHNVRQPHFKQIYCSVQLVRIKILYFP